MALKAEGTVPLQYHFFCYAFENFSSAIELPTKLAVEAVLL